jgi:hypothetical protein
MWRLTVAKESAEKTPFGKEYLYSLNDFEGRHVWVYDEKAGTKEERAQVRYKTTQLGTRWDRYAPRGDDMGPRRG